MDDFRAGRMATEHLIELGRKRIAHIAGKAIYPSRERMRGYKTALETRGLLQPESYLLEREKLEMKGDAAGYQCMKQLLHLKERPDAVFCYNDVTAIGAMHAVHEAGLRIPEDIAFVGCGNVGYSQYLRFPLTSIDQCIPEQGRVAAALALGLDGVSDQPPKKVMLSPKLVVRASTAGFALPARIAHSKGKPSRAPRRGGTGEAAHSR
jgi:LacI family transcriptional regulator